MNIDKISRHGKVIVIDGLDGCGKSTQFELVSRNLESKGYKIKPVSFPDYESPSSSLVKMYLAGEIAETADGVNAYAASSFYAVDRYASYKTKWEKNYLNGEIILAGRYVSSNAIHQMCKLSEEKHDVYLNWLFDYEYEKLGLPRADVVIFLDLPVEIAQKLLSKRYMGDENKKDIHEADLDYLKKCRKNALYAAEKLNWKVIDCMKNDDEIKSVEEINRVIMSVIDEVL